MNSVRRKIAVSVDSTVVAAKGQVAADLGKETVILHLKNAFYYGLNEMGTRVWNLIQNPRKVFGIRNVLVEKYDVDPKLCERDVVALLEDLAAEGLIEVKNG